MSSSNHPYYYGITDGHPQSSSSDTKFYVSWGHYAGSGSNTHGNQIKGTSQTVYGQMASLFLDDDDIWKNDY